MKYSIFILVFLITKVTFSTDVNIICGKDTISCENGGKDCFGMILYCPYDEADTSKLPKIILDNCKKYLISRVGESFYRRLYYNSCQIINFEDYNRIHLEKPYISGDDCDKKIKYSIMYYFKITDTLRYYLTLVFDKNGKIISKDQLPNVNKNKSFSNMIDICEAVKIAKQDSLFP